MKKVNENVRYYENYFSGFKDVYKANSTKKVFFGLAKIASYFSVVAPAIFGGLYLLELGKRRKIKKLFKEVDSFLSSSTLKTCEVGTQLHQSKQIEQRKLIQYAYTKAKDHDWNRFSDAFLLLNEESQAQFFHRIKARELMKHVCKNLPKKIEFLSFCNQHVDALLKHLPDFTNLKKLNLNLKDMGFFSANVYLAIEEMKKHNSGAKTTLCWLPVNSESLLVRQSEVWIERKNVPSDIIVAIEKLRLFLFSHPVNDLQIIFNNIGIKRKSGGRVTYFMQSIGLKDEDKYCKSLHKYLLR